MSGNDLYAAVRIMADAIGLLRSSLSALRRNARGVISDLRRLAAGANGIFDVSRELAEGKIVSNQHTVMNHSDQNREIHRTSGVLSHDVSDTSRVMGEKTRSLADMRTGLRQIVIEFINGWHLSALASDSGGFSRVTEDILRLNTTIERQLLQPQVAGVR